MNGVRGRRGGPLAMLQRAWTHPSNRGRRMLAVLRGFYHLVMTRVLGRPTTARLGRGMRLHVNPSRPASSRVVIANPPDPEEIAVWRQVLRPGDEVIDVGSNIGIYALLYADMGATVSCVEPGDTTELRRNLALNGIDAPVLQVAVSDAAGTVRFSTSRDQENAIVGASADVADTVEVEAVTLDSIIGSRHVRGVKIDVEGFERLVLEGAREALASHRVDVFQLEWNRQSESAIGEDRKSVAALLAEHGYVLASPRLDGSLVRCDGGYQDDDSIDLFAVSPAVAPGLVTT